jgi:Ca-activated chloride channel family protein
LSFDRPVALLSLAVVAALVAAFATLARRRPRYVVRYPNVDVLRGVSSGVSGVRRYAPLGLVAAALALLGVAAAGPHVTRSAPVENATVLLVVDTSRSMLSTDVRPTRLDAAKAAAQTFLERAPGKLRVGLVTFSGDVSVAAVPTRDRERVRRSVGEITRWQAGGGTAIGDALARAVELGQSAFGETAGATGTGSRVPENAVSILFLSDGRQNRGLLPPAEGASRAAAAGIPVFTVALGTDRPEGNSSPGGPGGPGGFGGLRGFNRVPDRATLRAIAEATDGEYFAARSAAALESAYRRLGSQLGHEDRPTEVTALFVGAAAVVLAAGAALARLAAPGLP